MTFFDQVVFGAIGVFGSFGPPFFLTWGLCAIPDEFKNPTWRTKVAVIAMAAITLRSLLFLFEVFQLMDFRVYSEKGKDWLDWSRFNFKICSVILIVSLFGRGRLRLASALNSLALIALSVVIYFMQ